MCKAYQFLTQMQKIITGR